MNNITLIAAIIILAVTLVVKSRKYISVRKRKEIPHGQRNSVVNKDTQTKEICRHKEVYNKKTD